MHHLGASLKLQEVLSHLGIGIDGHVLRLLGGFCAAVLVVVQTRSGHLRLRILEGRPGRHPDGVAAVMVEGGYLRDERCGKARRVRDTRMRSLKRGVGSVQAAGDEGK